MLQDLWRAAANDRISVVSSELCLLETLVKPVREGKEKLADAFRALLLQSREFKLLPIDQSVIELAIHIRAKTGLKTPDAIHAATAISAGASLLLTNDPGFRRIPNLSVQILSDLQEPESGNTMETPPEPENEAKPRPLPTRHVAGQGWEVLIVQNDRWLQCDTEQDAQAIAASSVLEYECLAERRQDIAFADQLEETARVFKK